MAQCLLVRGLACENVTCNGSCLLLAGAQLSTVVVKTINSYKFQGVTEYDAYNACSDDRCAICASMPRSSCGEL